MDPSTPLQPYTPSPGPAPVPPSPADPLLPPLPPVPAGTPATYIPPAGVGVPTAPPPSYPTIGPAQPYASGPVPTPPSSLAPPLPPPPAMTEPPFPAAPTAATDTVDLRHQLVEHLRKANNVLITVTSNPSIDQLAAAIGITLILNKLDKHATAVYSGETPSTLEFLQPEKTIEKNTDSLRDFIIALDKAKADKLRYKVEDKFVKIFITPFHTSLSENDLEFSQGDFNVDVVLALGVHQREELDQAITAHGRILHDAVTISINNEHTSDIGIINWYQSEASSLSEMLVSLVEPLQGDKVLLDSQTATAFLTGIVAETERFSNAKTTPLTMSVAATLMKAGANQQLVSSKLQAPQPLPKADGPDTTKPDATPSASGPSTPVPTPAKDGSLEISHKKEESSGPSKTLKDLEKENAAASDEDGDSDLAKIHIDEQGKLVPGDAAPPEQPPVSSNMVMQSPAFGGDLSAATKETPNQESQAAVDTPQEEEGGLVHEKVISPLNEEEKSQTLADLERAVDSSHVGQETASADAARQAVAQADAAVAPTRLEPVSALNAQPIDLQASESPASTDNTMQPVPIAEEAPAAAAPVPNSGDLTNDEVFPPQIVGPDKGLPADPTAGAANPSAPPPVPPPLMPPTV